ncbi:hypothetical protein [Bacteroides sp.]|uniref:hypothetical protein n=1 Tax=Bacteroides sp. TaxID=29523 RepID=UPI0026276677|nr:hypothetical protein [Bacteroides sp.]MDD3041149.1 hypothetical protein [Bacteroides sp.]
MAEVSNPFSTGGGGVSFETKIQSAFLATMLVQGRVPALPEGTIEKIRFQGRQAGYYTDDLVVFFRSSRGISHTLLAQIKHFINFSATDKVFLDVIENAWKDFNGPLFEQENGVLLLITGPLSAREITNIRPVLDWAKHCLSASEFLDKINAAKFSSDAKRYYTKQIRDAIERSIGNPVSDEQFWKFLRVFDWVSYDLDQDQSVNVSHLQTMLEIARGQGCAESVGSFWARLICFSQSANQNAATVDRESLPIEIKKWVSDAAGRHEDIRRLKEHTDQILEDINNTITVDNQRFQIERSDIVQLINLVDEQQIVIVTGEAGLGKSAVVKTYIERLDNRIPVLAFKAQEFNHSSLHQFFSSLGVYSNIKDLSSRLGMMQNKIFYLDGIEKILELPDPSAFRQFLQWTKKDTTIKLICSCRYQAVQSLQQFEFADLNPAILWLEYLSEKELSPIQEICPSINSLLANIRIQQLLRNPFYLSVACKIKWDAEGDPSILTLKRFRQIVWEHVIEKKREQYGGMPLKRRKTFIDISVRRAKAMDVAVPPGACDADSLYLAP